MTAFADNHGLPQERFYNLACLAFGSNPVQFADFGQKIICLQYDRFVVRMNMERWPAPLKRKFSPHIDYELAKSVVEANWLPAPVLPAEPLK